MNNKDELTNIRSEIDSIDKELASLLGKRIKAVAKVAEYKKQSGTAVLDTKREGEVIAKAVENSGMPDFSDGIGNIFKDIMNASRLYQYTALNADEVKAVQPSKEKENPTVAVLGVAGAFAHEAANVMFSHGKVVFCGTKEELAAKVKDGTADYGVLPIENSKEGSVNDVYDLVMSEKLYIAKAVRLRVEHCLACAPSDDAYLESITEVYSHMQALGQCRRYLDTVLPDARRIPMYNTAAAARMVSGLEDVKRAAICSEKAAELYGLKIIKKGIQDSDENSTRFIALSKCECGFGAVSDGCGKSKISLVFTLPHTKGALAMLLSSFASLGLNLTKIESRAAKEGGFEYSFYLDFEGSVEAPKVKGLLKMLETELQGFFFLGNYIEIDA